MKLKENDPSLQASIKYPGSEIVETNTGKTYTVQKKINFNFNFNFLM